MPYKHGSSGKTQKGVYESVKTPSKGKSKGPSNPSRKVSGGGASKRSQAY